METGEVEPRFGTRADEDPRRLGPATVLWSIRGLAEQFRPVPPRYFDGGQGRQRLTRCVLAVRCVCGARTVRPARAKFVECVGACGRWFMFGMHRVAAARFDPEADDGGS